MKLLALVLLLAVAGCRPPGAISDEIVTVSIGGSVTVAGQPHAGAVIDLFRPDIRGLPEKVGSTTTGASGAYSLITQVAEFRCIWVYVEIEVPDPSGGVLYSDRGNATDCGANTLDFSF